MSDGHHPLPDIGDRAPGPHVQQHRAPKQLAQRLESRATAAENGRSRLTLCSTANCVTKR